jgi:hypothetical protein
MSLNRHQFRTYYHGTSDRNVESIKKHGLKAHNPAEDYEGLEEGETHEPGHPEGVYLANNIEGAREYGDAVFSVELPNSAPWDWAENGEVLKHSISPLALKQVE